MKICFISASFVREREILENLNKKTDLLFIVPYRSNGNFSQQDIQKFCEKNRINFFINDYSKRRSRSLKNFLYDLKVALQIKRFRPNIIYIEAWGSPYFAFFCRVILGSKNTIIAIMDYKLHQRKKGSFKLSERFYQYFLNFYRNFQFFSYTQEKLFKQEHRSKNTFVIRLFLVGTDLPKLEKNKSSKTRFLYFGRIFFYKGVDILLEAVNILSENRDDFVVTIAGNANDWSEVYNPIIKNYANLNLYVRFIEKKELPSFFSAADFFIAPYREVTQSGPLLRAYNFDLIPITSNEEGFREYINDGENGLLFNSGSASDLALVMNKAISLKPAQKSQMLQNINRMKEYEFNISHVTEKYINMFNKIVDKDK